MKDSAMYRRSFLASAALASSSLAARAQPRGLIVFAAASLTEVMRDIDTLWRAAGHPALRMSFGSSSTLARQIEQGAPADIFASADEQWADYLQQHGLLAPSSRKDLLTNRLVLVMPKSTVRTVRIDPGLDLTALLGPTGRIAVGDPAHVPAGIYAQQALTRLGLWQQANARLARTEDVRGALLLVERGEAPVGIVYATDVAVSPSLAIAGTFPADTHDPIVYPFALVKGGDTAESRGFMQFLSSPDVIAAFKKRGFGVL